MTRLRIAPLLYLGLLLLPACAHESPRFTLGPVLRSVDDRRDVDEPAEREFYRLHHHFQNFFDRRIRLGLDPMSPPPSLDVNRWGEVVDSSWYTHRAELDPDEVFRGAGELVASPEAHFPWSITRVKVGGRNPGFMFEDASGERFILKVDKVGTPTIATAAGAVANRLFWALGYHVPDDRVVFFRRQDLELSAEARGDGITDAAVDRVLEGWATRLEDGRWRALVSRFLPGRPLGGFAYRGTREDDPNDRIPHERRRSLRAMRVFGAWLNHVDTKIDNTLDLYTERDGRRFVEHYLVDFDGCLGGYWAARHEKRIGWAYDLDLGMMISSIPKLGLDRRVYEALDDETVHPEIGLFEADAYDPASWRSNYVNDQILSANAADIYWAGQVLSRLGEAHMLAAARSGRFADPEAAALLTRVLLERWKKTVSWAMTRVTPVEGMLPIATSGGGFRVVAYDPLERLGLSAGLSFEVRALDADGHPLPGFLHVGSRPQSEVSPAAVADIDYCVLEWTAVDADGFRLPVSSAHYAREDSSAAWQLVGILRDGQ